LIVKVLWNKKLCSSAIIQHYCFFKETCPKRIPSIDLYLRIMSKTGKTRAFDTRYLIIPRQNYKNISYCIFFIR